MGARSYTERVPALLLRAKIGNAKIGGVFSVREEGNVSGALSVKESAHDYDGRMLFLQELDMITVTEHEITSERMQGTRIGGGIFGSIFLFAGLYGIYAVLFDNVIAPGGSRGIGIGIFTLASLIGLRLLAETGSYRLRLDYQTHLYEERSNFFGITRRKTGHFSDFSTLKLSLSDGGGVEALLYLRRRNSRRAPIWLANYPRLYEAKMELARLSALTGIQGEISDGVRLQKSV